MKESLDTDAEILRTLPDDVLRLILTQTHSVVLRVTESVKTNTLAPGRGPQLTCFDSEPLGGSWDKHQLLPFNLGLETSLTRGPYPVKRPLVSVTHDIYMAVIFCRSHY